MVLFATGKGNHGKDWSDVFQAVTDYYTHESAGTKATAQEQEESSEYKTGATKKARAYAILQNDAAIAATVAKGRAYLDKTTAKA